MFFDRLLKLQTLKFRLLGSTSFAQLYSAERLPLRKFRKEGAMLSPLIAGLLAACGGGGGGVVPIGSSRTPDPEPTEGEATFNLYVLDGATEGARVRVLNEDGSVAWEGTSNVDGRVDIPDIHAGKEVKVNINGAFDLATGQKFEDSEEYEVTLPDSVAEQAVVVASPITTIITQLLAGNDQLSTEDAIELIFGEDTAVTFAALNDNANYVLPSQVPTSVAKGDPLAIREMIAKTSIVVQKLLDQEKNGGDDSDSALSIIRDQADGLQLGDLDAKTPPCCCWLTAR